MKLSGAVRCVATTLLVAAGLVISVAPTPARADATIDFCSAAAGRAARAVTTDASYSRLRAALSNPANFGLSGREPRVVAVRPGIATFDTAALAGCDVFMMNEVGSSLSVSEQAAVVAAVAGGMTLIVDGDGQFINGINSTLGALGGGRAAALPMTCPSSTTGATLASIDNPATNGVFGDLRGATFATSGSLRLTAAGTDDVLASCSGATVRFVIPPNALGPGSGLVMAGGDPSALDFFWPGGVLGNANNGVLYLNAVAASGAVPPADLEVSQTCAPVTLPGEPYPCSVTVTNTGPGDATDVAVAIELGDESTTVADAVATNGFTCGSGDPFTCSAPTLLAGESTTITFDAIVPDTVGPETSWVSTSSATSSSEDPTLPNEASATTSTPTCTVEGEGSIRGTDGDDVICGSAGKDNVHAGDGNDIIFGLGGDDNLNGGKDNDRAFGGEGHDKCKAEIEKGCESQA